MSANGGRSAWIEYHRALLEQLCPPFEGAGFGGAPEDETDHFSDLDCFLLAADADLDDLVSGFPRMVAHPEMPVVTWRRGFHPGFGYQFVFVYPGARMVDYFLNSHATLPVTPMTVKTRIVVDRTGWYQHFLAGLRARAEPAELSADHRLASPAAEFTVELIKVRKYLARGELVAALHRLERFRLILLGLHRMRSHDEPYNPHDADKHVHAEAAIPIPLLATTFAGLSTESYRTAFNALCAAIDDLLTSGADDTVRSVAQRRLDRDLVAEIRGYLH